MVKFPDEIIINSKKTILAKGFLKKVEGAWFLDTFFVSLLFLPTFWCAHWFLMHACQNSGCHVSTSSLDCALSTFVCYTEKEYGAMAMGEIEKRKLAKKISPHLLSESQLFYPYHEAPCWWVSPRVQCPLPIEPCCHLHLTSETEEHTRMLEERVVKQKNMSKNQPP